MKLELKHLAGYLPYNLKICYMILDLKNGDPNTGDIDDRMKDCFMILTPLMLSKLDFKPILRPLSDLTKEIEINGEKFAPNINLSKGRVIEYPT